MFHAGTTSWRLPYCDLLTLSPLLDPRPTMVNNVLTFAAVRLLL